MTARIPSGCPDCDALTSGKCWRHAATQVTFATPSGNVQQTTINRPTTVLEQMAYEQGVKDGRAQVLAEVQEAIAEVNDRWYRRVQDRDRARRVGGCDALALLAERVREIGMSE